MDEAFKVGKTVAFIGKTSGQQVGTYSHIQACVNLLDSPCPTKEHVIRSLKIPALSWHGDSGSWICNLNGDVLGMLIGGSAAGETYFTPT